VKNKEEGRIALEERNGLETKTHPIGSASFRSVSMAPVRFENYGPMMDPYLVKVPV
jgi:hypothetical protein